jgi:5'-nucleotidase/UDP-sugar diphosphatase
VMTLVKRLSLAALLLILVACQSMPGAVTPAPTATPGAGSLAVTVSPAEATPTDVATGVQQLVILYTNDEHGWMEPTEESGGAAGMAGLWRDQEGYVPDGPYLVLSGGDTWTGPAISTWFDGEPMIEVMNRMGYDAAAVGNHEFDFGLDILRERTAQAEFPFLAANLRDRETGAMADVALPYVVQEVSGVQVGLIGLTTLSAPQTTRPDNVAGFEFADYEEALREVVPQARADGAELLVTVGHICLREMRDLVPAAAELGITIIGGGHCHEQVSQVVDGIALIESGSNLAGYVRVDLEFDTGTDTVVSVKTAYRPNAGGLPAAEISELVARWREETDEALNYPIGYLEKPLGQNSDALFNLVTDAWLAAYPAADVALTNRGGFRQDLPAGEVTLAAVVGVLPFDNVLIDVTVTGAELIDNIRCCGPVMAGMTAVDGYRLANGTEIDPAGTYHVLINDFMYAGGDGYTFGELDPEAYNTAIDWRQPVIDWISALGTTAEDPLDTYVDAKPRQ